MVEFAFIALVGLLILIPIIVFFLIVLAALKSRPAASKIVIPEPKRQERYGWEDHLKLKPTPKPSDNRSAAIIILIFLALIVVIPTIFFVIPSITPAEDSMNISEDAILAGDVNITEDGNISDDVNITDDSDVSEGLTQGPTNFTTGLPGVNVTISSLKLSNIFGDNNEESYAPYVTYIAVGTITLLVILAIFIMIVNRNKHAVIRKAKQTAEKLEKKPEPIPKKSRKFPKLPNLKKHSAPIGILAALITAALLIFFFRSSISEFFSDSNPLVAVKDFLLIYRIYIIAGVIFLILFIVFMRKQKNRSVYLKVTVGFSPNSSRAY